MLNLLILCGRQPLIAGMQHYNHIVNQNHIQAAKEYRNWIESYSVDDIRKANLARSKLRRMGINPCTKLNDARSVKKFSSAFIFFYTERKRSGDYKGIKITEASKLLGREFKELSKEERQVRHPCYSWTEYELTSLS